MIIWLASYPKSGNTLLRSILIALFFTKDGVFNLDNAFKIRQFETTQHIYNNYKMFGNDYKDIYKIKTFYKYLLCVLTLCIYCLHLCARSFAPSF